MKGYKMKGKPMVRAGDCVPGTMGHNSEFPRKRGSKGPTGVTGVPYLSPNKGPTTQQKMSSVARKTGNRGR